jgi:hypothetical protein
MPTMYARLCVLPVLLLQGKRAVGSAPLIVPAMSTLFENICQSLRSFKLNMIITLLWFLIFPAPPPHFLSPILMQGNWPELRTTSSSGTPWACWFLLRGMRGPHLHAAHLEGFTFSFGGVAFSLKLSLTHSAWGYLLVSDSKTVPLFEEVHVIFF